MKSMVKFQIADSYYNEKNYEKAASLYKEVYNQFGETFMENKHITNI